MAIFEGGDDDTIVGTDEDDSIFGGAVVDGRGGNDTIVAVSARFITGGYGDDFIEGGSFERPVTLNGGAGDDTIYGEGFAKIDGGSGNDYIWGYGTRGDVQIEGGKGNDTIVASLDGVVMGGAGDDVIEIYAGAPDKIIGGDGFDVVTLDNNLGDPIDVSSIERVSFATQLDINSDVLIREQFQIYNTALAGQSVLIVRINTESAEFSDVSIVNWGSTDVILLYGDEASGSVVGTDYTDLIFGFDGADTLDGGGAKDALEGGDGDDVYFVDVPEDLAIERAGEGRDVVFASCDYRLRAGQHVEVLRADAVAGLRLLGNAFSNLVVGGDGADSLTGGGGDDVLVGGGDRDGLSGGAGHDVLRGEKGDDMLFGGRGADRLIGGEGADRFVYRSVDDSAAGRGRDRIVDFDASEGDRIVLSPIDADAGAEGDQRFAFIGVERFSGTAGELRVAYLATGALLQADVDGDRRADFATFLEGATALEVQDFIL